MRRPIFFVLALVLSTAIAEDVCAQSVRLQEQIADVLDSAQAELVAIRRDIHQNPEVSGQEERTAGIVAHRLRSLGLEVQTGIGGHGVVGVLRGGKPGRTVAYRADMDAVRSSARDPVASIQSNNAGIRHICGHDIHTTVALGVAQALAAIRADLGGTVKFIFQPAEENVQGAQAMIHDGVLNDPSPEAIFAVHSSPLEVGQVGVIEGMGLSGIDRIVIRLSGNGDLNGVARDLVDSIGALSTVGAPGSPEQSEASEDGSFAFVQSRSRPNPKVAGGWNVFASVKASGEEQYAGVKAHVHNLLDSLPTEEITSELTYIDRELPDMMNDTSLVRGSLEAIRSVLGEEGLIIGTTVPPYFGEDFSFYQQEIPGVMYWLGVSNSGKGIVGMPHSPDFVADEAAIVIGSKAMSAVLLSYLEGSVDY